MVRFPNFTTNKLKISTSSLNLRLKIDLSSDFSLNLTPGATDKLPAVVSRTSSEKRKAFFLSQKTTFPTPPNDKAPAGLSSTPAKKGFSLSGLWESPKHTNHLSPILPNISSLIDRFIISPNMSQNDDLQQQDTDKLPEHLLEGEEEADKELRNASANVADALRSAKKVDGSLNHTPLKKTGPLSPSKQVTPEVKRERMNTSANYGPDPLPADRMAPHDRSRYIGKGTYPRSISQNTAPLAYDPVRACKRSDLPDDWDKKIPLKHLKFYKEHVVTPPDDCIIFWEDPENGQIQWLWPSCCQEDGDQAFVDGLRDPRFGPTSSDGLMTTAFAPNTHVILNVPQYNVATATAFVTHDEVIEHGGKYFQRVEVEEWPPKSKQSVDLDQLNCVFWPVEYLLELHEYSYSQTKPYKKVRKHPNAWQVSDLRRQTPGSCSFAREGKFYIFMGLNPEEEYALGDLCDKYGDREVVYGDSIIAKLESLDVKNKNIRDKLASIDAVLINEQRRRKSESARRTKTLHAKLKLEVNKQAKESSGDIHKRITASQNQIDKLKKEGELKRVTVAGRSFLMARNPTDFRKALRKSNELETASTSGNADGTALSASSQPPVTVRSRSPVLHNSGLKGLQRSRSLSNFWSDSWKNRWEMTEERIDPKTIPGVEPRQDTNQDAEPVISQANKEQFRDLRTALIEIQRLQVALEDCTSDKADLQVSLQDSHQERADLEVALQNATQEKADLKQQVQDFSTELNYLQTGENRMLTLATSFDEFYTKFKQLSDGVKGNEQQKEGIDAETDKQEKEKLSELVGRLETIVTTLEPQIRLKESQGDATVPVQQTTVPVEPATVPVEPATVPQEPSAVPVEQTRVATLDDDTPVHIAPLSPNTRDLVNSLFPHEQAPQTVAQTSPTRSPSPVPSDGIYSEPSICEQLRASKTVLSDSDDDLSSENGEKGNYEFESDQSDISVVGEITEEKMRKSKDPLKLWSLDALNAWLPIDCNEEERSLAMALVGFYKADGSHEAFRDLVGNLYKARPTGKWSGISIHDPWLDCALIVFRLLECSKQLGRLIVEEEEIMAIRWFTFKAPKFNWQRVKLTRDAVELLKNVISMMNNELPEISDGAVLSDFLYGRGMLARVLPFSADKVRERLDREEGKRREGPRRRAVAVSKDKKVPLNLEMVQKSVMLALKKGVKRKSSGVVGSARKLQKKEGEEGVGDDEGSNSDRDEIMQKRTKAEQKKLDMKKKTPRRKGAKKSVEPKTPSTPLLGRVARKQVGGTNGKKVELTDAGKYSTIFDKIKGALDKRLEQCLSGPPRKRADRPFGQLSGLFNVGLHDLLFKRLTKGLEPDIRTFAELNASLTLLKTMMKECKSDKAMARLVIKQFPWVELLLVLYIAWRLEKTKKNLSDDAIFTLFMGYNSSKGKYPGLLDKFRQSCHMWAGRLECIRIGVALGTGHKAYAWRAPDARADYAAKNGLLPMDTMDSSGNPAHVYPEYKVMAWMLKSGVTKVEYKTHNVLKRKPLMVFGDNEAEEEGEELFGEPNTQQVEEELGLFLERFDAEAEMPADRDWEKEEAGEI